MSANLRSIAREADLDLHRTVDAWFPRCLDEDKGGFYQSFDRHWQPRPESERSLVFQSRMTWVLATLARRRPHMKADHSLWASHGIRFIEERFLDPVRGGLWFQTGLQEEKHSYGIAFGIFAAAACSRAMVTSHATDIALELFHWWTRRAFDEAQGAFFDALDPDGAPRLASGGHARDAISVPYGLRSLNTHLHAIEAVTELYRATEHRLVRANLEALLGRLEALIENHGRLYTTYTRDWRPVDRSISYGHDIEALYLALDARNCLGWPRESPALQLLPTTLDRGIDRRFGGMFYGYRRWRRVTQKIDWVQAEALNTLSYVIGLLSRPCQSYADALANVWSFVSGYVIDVQNGGWRGRLDRRGRILDDRKGHRWKACYHPVRALLSVSEHLEPAGTGFRHEALTSPGNTEGTPGYRTD